MCYNAEISLNTFIFGMICAIIIWKMNMIEKISILLLISITAMQLLEYFTWKNINNENIIYYLSIIGLIIIFIQISLIIYSINNNIFLRIILYILLIFFVILYLLTDFTEKKLRMYKGENGHLVWEWLDIPVIWIIIGISFYIIPLYISSGIYNIRLISTIIILSLSLYYYYKYKTWATLWCYFSNINWILLLIYSIYLYLNKN